MTKELKGVAIILSIYLLGEVVSRLIGGFMPGSVIGMVTLFGLLQSGAINEEEIKSVASFVLNNMMLFFVPVTVGLMVSIQMIGSDWVGVSVTLLVATIIVIVVVGLVQQFLGRLWKR